MVSLTPIKTGEYTERARRVTVPFAGANAVGAADLVSSTVFGERYYDDMSDRPLQQYHMRGYIDFTSTPVINPVLAGNGGSTLGVILGLSGQEMSDILGYKVVLDNGELVPVEEMPETVDIESIRIGAQILEYYIEKFDFEKSLNWAMTVLIYTYAKKAKVKAEGSLGTIVQTKTEFPIIGNYYFQPIVPGLFNPEHYHDYLSSLGDGAFKRIVYVHRLMQLPDGKDRLRGCIMHRIMVTPIGSRPSSDGNRHDTLTTAYAEVMKQQQPLAMAVGANAALDTVIQSYKMFDQAVDQLLMHHSKYRSNDKAVVERLIGKKGHIRNHMLGKRIDFSGRSVITIDPFMSIRDVGIPKDMLPKLYRSSILRTMANPQLDKYIGTKPQARQACLSRLEKEGILEDVNVIIGRQPTLHKPSMRSFHPVAVDGRSVQLNPLSVIGFNADFDGDQMYVRVPVTDAGKREGNELLGIEQNPYLPKNGECVVMPRQEIIYGLSVCTREGDYPTSVPGKSFSSVNALINAIRRQDVHIESKCSCGGYSGTAGRVAFMCCINKRAFSQGDLNRFQTMEVTSSSIKEIVNTMMHYDPHTAIDYIDSMVRLGFVVAGTYPPVLSLYDVDVDYSQQFHNFHAAIAEDTDLYERGWETEEEFDTHYTSEFDKTVDSIVKGVGTVEDHGSQLSRIESDIGAMNGFVRMARSGARGSKSNLLQLYGYKGRVQNGMTGGAFRAVIEHSYLHQLTPLEHFITAYGGRAALIQKSLNTADSGYAMRKIWHTTSPYLIRTEDCGTEEGLTIGMGDLYKEFGTSAKDVFVDTVTGRYLAKAYKDYPTSKVITREVAKAWAEDRTCSVVIRSILTCKDKCCKKCYGIDLSTNRLPAIGLPIGFIAAQSIGEPGTQLNMDAFKKGGVASAATSVRLSGFNKLTTYTECQALTKEDPSYDPVAWETGKVNERPRVDGTKAVYIEGCKDSIILPIGVMLKPEVHKGEGMRVLSGDKNVAEILRYDSLLAAQRYLCYALYSVYKDEGAVNMKHFEVLAEAMTMYRVLTTDDDSLVPGLWHDTIMMTDADLTNTTYVVNIKPVRAVQPLRPYALSRIAMEQVREGLASSVLLGLDDPLTYPFNRVLMGMTPWVHGAYTYKGDTNTFMEQRRI